MSQLHPSPMNHGSITATPLNHQVAYLSVASAASHEDLYVKTQTSEVVWWGCLSSWCALASLGQRGDYPRPSPFGNPASSEWLWCGGKLLGFLGCPQADNRCTRGRSSSLPLSRPAISFEYCLTMIPSAARPFLTRILTQAGNLGVSFLRGHHYTAVSWFTFSDATCLTAAKV